MLRSIKGPRPGELKISARTDSLRPEIMQILRVDIVVNPAALEKNLLRDMKSLISKEGYPYAGFPRFKGPFGRDMLITGWQRLKYDPSILKASLLTAAKLQGKRVSHDTGEEPGKIFHEYYPPEVAKVTHMREKSNVPWLKPGVAYYFSVDSTPLFLFTLGEYYKMTHDANTVNELWPSAIRALKWIEEYGLNKQGFLVHKKYPEEKGLVGQSWKDSSSELWCGLHGTISVVEVQGYLYAAYRSIAELALIVKGDTQLADSLNRKAEALKENFNKRFWMPDKSFYALAIDQDGHKSTQITSNPGHLLFTGILPKKREEIIIKRLFESDMYTSYGIRTHSSLEHDFDPLSYHRGSVWPSDNWIIAQGLKEDYPTHYRTLKDAIIKLAERTESAPEYVTVSRSGKLLPFKTFNETIKAPCNPQAWAVGAELDFLLDS